MDNSEKLVTLEGAITHRQFRETGYIGRGNQTWTIQRNWLQILAMCSLKCICVLDVWYLFLAILYGILKCYQNVVFCLFCYTLTMT
jgi:hypothetical protein